MPETDKPPPQQVPAAIKEQVIELLEQDQPDDLGDPSELTEWQDFDPDC
jgi:hypothetical protein